MERPRVPYQPNELQKVWKRHQRTPVDQQIANVTLKTSLNVELDGTAQDVPEGG